MTKQRTIYLCGPMEAVSANEASEWRNTATHILQSAGARVLDPCRRVHSFDPREMRRIFELDLRDIRESDIILANMSLMFDKPSHGTAQELFYANYILEKQVIAFKPEFTKMHPFIECTVTEWRSSVEKACDTIIANYL